MVRVLQPVRDWLGVSLDAGQGLNMGDAAQVLTGTRLRPVCDQASAGGFDPVAVAIDGA